MSEEIEKAKKLIEEQHKKDMQDCSKEIEDVLKKYECKMNVKLNLQGNQIIPQIIIVKNGSI
jgi:hypothetical protein